MKYGNGDCPECGDPNGYPCSSCGYRMPERSEVTAERKSFTEVERRVMRHEEEEADRRREERDELKEHYR
jgi:tRNA(Ile2) C34 agmatinyltransferase TiaS